MLQIFRKFMCIYTILKNFVDKRNKSGLNFVIQTKSKEGALMTCKNCGYENKLGVRYCQRCGQYIEPKRTLAQEVKSLDFRSLAGVGRRDVNIAPLFTASPVQTPAKAHQTPSPVEPMPDGRWYCPDCGTLNASSERFCKNCGKVR